MGTNYYVATNGGRKLMYEWKRAKRSETNNLFTSLLEKQVDKRADHIGKLFGADLNRKDTLDYKPDSDLAARFGNNKEKLQ